MNIYHIVIACIMLVSAPLMASEESEFLNPCTFPISDVEAPDYTLRNIATNYVIQDAQVKIKYDLEVGEPRPFLLIMTHLCDNNNQDLARNITTNFNLRWKEGVDDEDEKFLKNKEIKLRVQDPAPSDYKLVVRVLSTTRQERLENFPVTFSHETDVTTTDTTPH